ncbi:MAG TPA: PPC domain-containing protein [Chloroflexota bacterium]|nr:PPC domain-containing protein [Chloroflexota bacterium]
MEQLGLLITAMLSINTVLSALAGLRARPAAQPPAPQLIVERPAAESAVRGTIVISGWAVDPDSTDGTGIAPDSVAVWLGPADSGRLLGMAGYGDPRPDLAEQFGDPRFLFAGFRYFWNSCEAPVGPQVLTITARSSAGGSLATTVPITVGSCDLQPGETVMGRIVTSGQVDTWTFQGTAGERVAITLDGFLLGGWDPFLELIAPDGTREDIDDDSGPDLDAWLSRRLAQSGTYTVRVRPFSTEGCTGDYVVLGWMGPPGRSDPNAAASLLGTTARFQFRGSLREFGERQSWTFDGTAGQELLVYMVRNLGSPLDPFLELLAPDGQLLARDDDSGGGLNAFIQGVLPQTGTYTLVAQSAREGCGGDYLLRIERDWGEQSQLRGELRFGDTVTGNLSRSVRRDVWTLPATAGERITLTLEPTGPARLQVAGPNGDWEQVRSSGGQPLGLSFVPAQSGAYQAVVFVDTSRPIDYQLTLERGFGRLLVERGPVPLGQPVQGEIRFAEGRDLYTFEGRAGQQVRIALDRPSRSRLDPYLELQGPDGRTIAEDDDSGGDLNALIQLVLPQTGTYTIVARGFEDTVGPYVLTVTLSDGAAPAMTPGPTPPAPGAPTPTPTPTSPPASPRPPTPSAPRPTPGPRR